MIPVTGEEFEYTPEDAKLIGLDVADESKGPLIFQDGDMSPEEYQKRIKPDEKKSTKTQTDDELADLFKNIDTEEFDEEFDDNF